MMMKIQWLVLDVDGVLTDGKVYICQHSADCAEYLKAFDTKDGRGVIDLLQNYNVNVALLTAESSGFPALRAAKLGIRRIGVCSKETPKLEILKDWTEGDLSSTCYIGDDTMDIPCLTEVAFAACPRDAHKDAISAVEKRMEFGFVSSRKGGRGCVREVIDKLIEEGCFSPKKI